jgi:hypothetical protein
MGCTEDPKAMGKRKIMGSWACTDVLDHLRRDHLVLQILAIRRIHTCKLPFWCKIGHNMMSRFGFLFCDVDAKAGAVSPSEKTKNSPERKAVEEMENDLADTEGNTSIGMAMYQTNVCTNIYSVVFRTPY